MVFPVLKELTVEPPLKGGGALSLLRIDVLTKTMRNSKSSLKCGLGKWGPPPNTAVGYVGLGHLHGQQRV